MKLNELRRVEQAASKKWLAASAEVQTAMERRDNDALHAAQMKRGIALDAWRDATYAIRQAKSGQRGGEQM